MCSVLAKRRQELLLGRVQAGPTLGPYRLYRCTCVSKKGMIGRWQSGLGAGFETWDTTGEKHGCHAANVSEKDIAMEDGRWESMPDLQSDCALVGVEVLGEDCLG